MNQLAMRRNANNLRNRRIRDEHYDYEKAVKEDALDALYDYDEAKEIEDVDDLVDFIGEKLWADDRVTGNDSGSYTMDAGKAMTYVMYNMDLLRDAIDDLGTDYKEVLDKFLDGDWEYFDVTIRCHVLLTEAYDIAEEFLKRKNK